MIVAFDASVLVYLFDRNARSPLDPTTGQAVANCKERIDFLLATLDRSHTKIVIPTPALAEVLVKAHQAAPEWLKLLQRSSHFRIATFDERAAVEYAAMQAQSRERGRATRAKAKFDDQIIAKAAVEGATVSYSDDPDIKNIAGTRFEVYGIGDLPLPPPDPQFKMQFDAASNERPDPGPNE